MKNTWSLISRVLIVAALASITTSTYGALLNATWTGASGNWSDGTKWSSNPTFPNNGVDTWNANFSNNTTITLDQNITIQAFNFNGGSGTLDTVTGRSLTTNALVTFGPGGNNFMTGNGILNANAGVAFGSNGGSNPATRSSWTINLFANSSFITGAGWNMENTGTINVKPGVIFDQQGNGGGGGNISGAGTINNEGTWQRTTNATGITINNVFNNLSTGQVNVTSGDLALSGGGTQDGDFSVASGKTLQLGGTHNFNTGSSVTGAGHFRVNNGTFAAGSSINIGGNLTIDGTPVFNSGTTTLVGGNLVLTSTGSQFSGTNDISVTGIFNWNAGNNQVLSGAGKVTTLGGFQYFNSNGTDSNSKTLDVYGTSFLNSNNGWTFTNTGIINVKGGTFDYQSQTNATSAQLIGAGTINNEGVFFRSVTTIAGVIANSFNNLTGGVLRADASTTLNLTGPYSQTGGTILINGGTLNLSSPSFTGGFIKGGSGGVLNSTVNATGGTGLTISPGNSTSTLQINGAVTLDSNDFIEIELGGTAQGNPVSGYDLLNVNGILNITGSQLAVSLIGGFNPSNLNTFTIITATSIIGQFSNTPGNKLLVDTYTFDVTYTANQVILSNALSSVPEPSTLALLSLGGLGLVLRRRRHKRIGCGYRNLTEASKS